MNQETNFTCRFGNDHCGEETEHECDGKPYRLLCKACFELMLQTCGVPLGLIKPQTRRWRPYQERRT